MAVYIALSGSFKSYSCLLFFKKHLLYRNHLSMNVYKNVYKFSMSIQVEIQNSEVSRDEVLHAHNNGLMRC